MGTLLPIAAQRAAAAAACKDPDQPSCRSHAFRKLPDHQHERRTDLSRSGGGRVPDAQRPLPLLSDGSRYAQVRAGKRRSTGMVPGTADERRLRRYRQFRPSALQGDGRRGGSAAAVRRLRPHRHRHLWP